MNVHTRLHEFEKYHISTGILFLDIDHFKRVNDRYGHDTGDRILRMVATTIANSLRSLDLVCRWGGEEFIIILPNVDAPSLNAAAERIRFFIEKSWLAVHGEHLYTTVSIGGTLLETKI